MGEHEHGLYAMPSLVDEQTLTISPTSNGPLLLEGPQNFQVPAEINLVIIKMYFISRNLIRLHLTNNQNRLDVIYEQIKET